MVLDPVADGRALRQRGGVAAVGVGARLRLAVFIGHGGLPRLPGPVDAFRRRRSVAVFPPDGPFGRLEDVCEDGVLFHTLDRVGIGLPIGPRRDAEEAVFRVDGP